MIWTKLYAWMANQIYMLLTNQICNLTLYMYSALAHSSATIESHCHTCTCTCTCTVRTIENVCTVKPVSAPYIGPVFAGHYKLATGRFVKEQCNWDLTLYAHSYTLTPCNIQVYEQKGVKQ